MTKELLNDLEAFAKKRADDVYDVDIHELRQLVIDGAKWALKNASLSDIELEP
jgi:phage terminase large subunit-like protein